MNDKTKTSAYVPGAGQTTKKTSAPVDSYEDGIDRRDKPVVLPIPLINLAANLKNVKTLYSWGPLPEGETVKGRMANRSISETMLAAKAHEKVSKARSLKNGLRSESNDGTIQKEETGISPSYLTRALRGERTLNDMTVGYLGQAAADLLGYEKSIGEGDPQTNLYAGESLIAELRFWENQRLMVEEPPASKVVRPPVVKREKFREVTQAIFQSSSSSIITIISEQEKQGRSAFATSACLYASMDAPAHMRRSLFVCSLENLKIPDIDIDPISQLVAGSLMLPRRSGMERDLAIAEYLRQSHRPLLLIRNTNGVSDKCLAAFVANLFRKTSLPNFKIVIVSRQPLQVSAHKDEKALFRDEETTFSLDAFLKGELTEFFRWRTNVNLSVTSFDRLSDLFEKFPAKERRAALPGLFAGMYLLHCRTKSAPWEWLQVSPNDENDPATIIESLLLTDGLDDHSKCTLDLLYPVFLKQLKNDELISLVRLCTFEGSFTKNAAMACLRGDVDNTRLESILDRLFLSGALFVESTDSPVSFLVENDLRDWIREAEYLPSIEQSHPYNARFAETRSRYWMFIQWRIRQALSAFVRDPHTIDPASPNVLSILMPEIRNIDVLLRDVWLDVNDDLKSRIGCSLPEEIATSLPGLTNESRGVVLTALMVANLAPLGDAQALLGVTLLHLEKASEQLFTLLVNKLDSVARMQIQSIYSQLVLSKSLIQTRHRQWDRGHLSDEDLKTERVKNLELILQEASDRLFTLLQNEPDSVARMQIQSIYSQLVLSKSLIQTRHRQWDRGHLSDEDLKTERVKNLELILQEASDRLFTLLQNKLDSVVRMQIVSIYAQLVRNKSLIQTRHRQWDRGHLSDEDLKTEQVKNLELILQEVIAAESFCYEAGYGYGKVLSKLVRGTISNRQKNTDGLDLIKEAVEDAAKMANEYAELVVNNEKTTLWMQRDRHPLSRYLAFSGQRELARAQLRADNVLESLKTSTSLLQAASATRESRIIADSLLAQALGLFCHFAKDKEESFGEFELRAVRDILFQCDVFIAQAPGDRDSLKGQYFMALGAYNVEKSLSISSSSEFKFPNSTRQAHGLALFHLGYSQTLDVHHRGAYGILLAYSFLRSVPSDMPMKDSMDNESAGNRISIYSVAAAYFVRGLEDLRLETNAGVELSGIIRSLIIRFSNRIGGATRVRIAINMYYATTLPEGTSRSYVDKLEKNLTDYYYDCIREN